MTPSSCLVATLFLVPPLVCLGLFRLDDPSALLSRCHIISASSSRVPGPPRSPVSFPVPSLSPTNPVPTNVAGAGPCSCSLSNLNDPATLLIPPFITPIVKHAPQLPCGSTLFQVAPAIQHARCFPYASILYGSCTMTYTSFTLRITLCSLANGWSGKLIAFGLKWTVCT